MAASSVIYLFIFFFVKMSRNVNDNFQKGDRAEPTKVVVRRLPPDFAPDVFLDQVSPLPEYNHFYFVGGGGPNAFSRAYINFERYGDVLKFKEKFDDYTFLGPNGVEYPAVVELAPFQNVCKGGTANKKRDAKVGTIQFDGYYKKFLDATRCKHVEIQRAEFCFQPKTDSAAAAAAKETIYVTPLLKYMKERKKKTAGHDEKKRNFYRGRGRCQYENCIVFVNSAAKKTHHVRNNDGRKQLTFV